MTVANDIITGYPISTVGREVTISPNPAVSDLFVSLPSHEGNWIQYEIIDINGRKMDISGTVTGIYTSEFTIGPVDKLIPGIYMLKITTQNNIYTAKFIKR
jgi:hypothetical protein